jgi:transposase
MEESMESAVTIGLDLGKSIFQVHGVSAAGAVVVQRRLTRNKLLQFFAKQPACLVGMEACAAAHHWGRELRKLGHTVQLMPPRYVKPYVKRQKNDAADAEAICEAVTRPTMRFVEIKTCEQQGTLVLHRVRLMLTWQRTQLSNAIRGHMGEYGLVAPVGRIGLERLIAILGNPDDERVPAVARASLAPLVCQLALVNDQVLENDRRVKSSARSTELGCRLMGTRRRTGTGQRHGRYGA